jgi:hypothetical protein
MEGLAFLVRHRAAPTLLPDRALPGLGQGSRRGAWRNLSLMARRIAAMIAVSPSLLRLIVGMT